MSPNGVTRFCRCIAHHPTSVTRSGSRRTRSPTPKSSIAYPELPAGHAEVPANPAAALVPSAGKTIQTLQHGLCGSERHLRLARTGVSFCKRDEKPMPRYVAHPIDKHVGTK